MCISQCIKLNIIKVMSWQKVVLLGNTSTAHRNYSNKTDSLTLDTESCGMLILLHRSSLFK